ncbi:GNAT family N-acetyltransferase [Olivibacter jilunii]|uniref:GNAT family N-acetyltransferase n=1 Tax=Olivibacter jilunii TaxID=985016 RepID=UPI003F17BE47
MVQDFSNSESKLSALVNIYCREFGNWSLYAGTPRHNSALAKEISKAGSDLHIKIAFVTSDLTLFIPVTYFSDVGEHRLRFPAFIYQKRRDEFCSFGAEQFSDLIEMITSELKQAGENPDVSTLSARLCALAAGKDKWILHNGGHLISFKCFQEGVETQSGKPLIIYCLDQFISRVRLDPAVAIKKWLDQYLTLLTYNSLDTEFVLDDVFLPRASNNTTRHVAAKLEAEASSTDDWVEEVLIGHLFPIIAAIGEADLVSEKLLISEVYDFFAKRASDPIAAAIVTNRHFKVKGRLTKEASYHRLVPNVLHEVFRENTILNPVWNGPVYFKYYEKEQVAVSIRPFDIERDLTMVHEWFHREHAKAIWQMDWSLAELEAFYRTLLPSKWAQAYIGEINGKPTFNFEVYWATRDIVGDYFDVLPTDYGTHLFIAPTDKREKFPSITMQSILDWLFAQEKVGRLVGEGAVESMAALMNKVHVGFRLQGIINMPHKKAHLNFCYREWYWEKFPQNRPVDRQVPESATY